MNDLKHTARRALKSTKVATELLLLTVKLVGRVRQLHRSCSHSMRERANPKWSTKLAGYDVYIWDQGYDGTELRIDEQ
jgi:hypothetical protein